MTRVSCQKIRGSIPGSPKWSDDSWRLCICKVTHPRPRPKGGESELRAIHAGFYIPYFTYSTTTPFCLQGRGGWTESNSCRIFIFLTSHIQQQRLFVSKGGESEQRAIHAGFYIPYFTHSTTTPSCFQGRGERTEGIPCEPSHHLLLIFNKQCLLFPREEKLLREYWYGKMNGLADWSHIEPPCNLHQIIV